jgi:hypothetical protein
LIVAGISDALSVGFLIKLSLRSNSSSEIVIEAWRASALRALQFFQRR